jgi:uncharacterized protein YjiS (DUF1127 family)
MDKRNHLSLRLWRHARVELTGLTDRTLEDIGLWRGHERFGATKLFWIP